MPPGQLDAVARHLHRLAGTLAGRDVTDAELLGRYVAGRDESAVAALVERHGGLVWSVCRRLLSRPEDVEDAFQATFLVLIRKAASVCKREAVASWLYGVAYRTAMKAKQSAARRRAQRPPPSVREPEQPVSAAALRELQALLDQEVQRLPEKYRAPFVLCCLGGKSQAEAARQLAWKEGTVAGRIAEARKQLQRRLAHRGVTLSAALCAGALSGSAVSAALPATLAVATMRAAARDAAGPVSAGAGRLAQAVLKGMAVSRAKAGAALVLALGLLAGGVAARQVLVAEPAPPADAPAVVKDTRPQPPARADLHGDPLPPGARARLGTVRFRGADGMHYLVYTPDGKLLASGGSDGARIWDAATGKEVRRLPLDQCRDPYGPIAFSADGKLIAVGGYDQERRGGAVYEISTGRRLYRFGKPGVYAEARFSPNDHILAVTYSVNDPTIDLHDAATGAPVRSLVGHRKRTDLIIQQAQVVFCPGGKILVSAGADGTIRLWNMATGQEVRTLTVAPRYIDHIALSPDGSCLATTDFTKIGERPGQTFWDHRVQLWTLHIRGEAVAIGKEVRRLAVPAVPNPEGRQFQPASLAFTADGKGLVIGGWDKTVRVLDLATGKEKHRFAGYATGVSVLAVAPDGKSFAVVDPMVSIRVCHLTTGRDLVQMGGHGDALSAVAVSPDDRAVATASRDGTVRLWDARTGRQQRLLARDQPHLRRRLVFAPDGQSLFVAGGDDMIRVWNPATGRELRSIKRHPSGWDLLALSPDGKTLVSEAPGNTLVLMDAATGKELRTLKGATRTLAGVGFTDGGGKVLAWSFDDDLHSWDVATGRHQRRPCKLHDEEGGGTGARAVAFTPDGRLVALGGSARTAVLSVETCREVCRFAHGDGSRNDSVQFLAFSPDGRTLAWSVARDSIIRLGEVHTGKGRHRLAGHRGHVEAAVFAHDGSFLVSGAGDTTALVWDLNPRRAAAATAARAKSTSDTKLAEWWTDLTSTDARKAYRAICALAAAPGEAVPLLKERLRPVVAPDARGIGRLIADLDSGRFATRERATQELEQLGELAELALLKAQEGRSSPEVRRRVNGLLTHLHGPARSPATLQALRAVEVLEHIGTPAAQEILKTLATGTSSARLTQEAKASLARFVRPATARP
jgi:RNA polymerase sigma factor (sigma-70 family)